MTSLSKPNHTSKNRGIANVKILSILLTQELQSADSLSARFARASDHCCIHSSALATSRALMADLKSLEHPTLKVVFF